MKTKINICCIGDPKNPRTWSGTPYNIYSELKKRNIDGDAFNADIPKNIKMILDRLTIMQLGKMGNYERTPLRRYACFVNSAIRTLRSTTNHTVHLGTLSLPFLLRPVNQFHYLFCDSTFNLWSKYSTSNLKYPEKINKLFDQLEQQAYLQVNHIFSISQYVKDNLIQHYGISPQKISVVGTGLGAIKPFKGIKDYTNRKILFVAKERFRDKGGELVIEAFKRALLIDPNLRLTIVGSEEFKIYQDIPNISVFGFVPLSELQRLFNTHSLFLLPAINEPWGLVYLEAMACKMPIVGFNRNSFPEISGLGKYGFMLMDDYPDHLALALVEAFRNPEKLKEIGEEAQYNCLNNYSWEKTVNKMINIIDNI